MKSLLTLLTLSLLTTQAMANELTTAHCDHPSHGLATLGDEYYDLDDRYQISEENRESLHAFYQQLEGRWHGDMIDRPCTRKNDETPKRARYYELKKATADIDHNGMLIIRAEQHPYEPVDGNHRYEPIRLNSRIDFWPGKDLSALEFLDENTVTAVSHYRQKNHGVQRRYQGTTKAGMRRHTTSLRERQVTLMLQGDTLLIQSRWYINGYFTGTESFKLTRK